MSEEPTPPSLVAELRNISVTYGAADAAVQAVRGVSLEVHRGEVLLTVHGEPPALPVHAPIGMPFTVSFTWMRCAALTA